MFDQQIVREAPVSFDRSATDRSAVAPDEPVLNIDNMQGNLIGFNKDFQTMLFIKITDAAEFKKWLAGFVRFVATGREVWLFNKLFKEIRSRRKVETNTVQATWINIAFSFEALQKLTANTKKLKEDLKHFPDIQKAFKTSADLKPEAFADEAFKQGMAARAIDILGDPAWDEAEGNPRNWVFGAGKHEADAVIIVASDTAEDLREEVERIENGIYSGRTLADENQVDAQGEHPPISSSINQRSGLHIVYKQPGATLPPPLVGHEHFGFLDGVSQPGLRGTISKDPLDVLTARQNPSNPNQGKPGQDLLYPGEFIFGYPRQDKKNADGSIVSPADAPAWAKDGSFLVVRRLRQEVAGFHKFLEETAAKIGLSPEKLGAKIVGRWASGAPISRQPDADNPALADDDCANNHFEFAEDGEAIPKNPAKAGQCADEKFPLAAADTKGLRCPFAAHIRKTYPRDDIGSFSDKITEASTQTHRLLRRGIPFGDPYFPPKDPSKQKDTGNRGLVFAAYQTSIVNQFEFVQKSWSNNPEFKDKTKNGKLQTGHDLIIGQHNGAGKDRTRRFILPIDKNGKIELVEITAKEDWVIPTGGGYFFQPSIDALCLLSGVRRDQAV